MIVRPATIEDAWSLAPYLRKADLDELQAVDSRPTEEVLIESVRDGLETYAVEADNGRTVALFGLHHFAPLDEAEGVVWMLGSDELRSYQTAIMRDTPKILHRFHQKFPLLWNVVDERNTVHINWLKRLGFVALQRHPRLGVQQRPFIEFIRIDPCVVSPQLA